MTHTLHRQGDVESLREDYVVLILGKDIPFSPYRMRFSRRFPRIYGIVKKAFLSLGILRMLRTIRRIGSGETHRCPVFNDKKELATYLKGLKERNLGKSVVVSGLFTEVNDCLREINLSPHTIQFSLGIFGKTELLPKKEIIEITTMCGHHMISPRLAERLTSDVTSGKLSREEAVRVLSKQCVCGICNKTRLSKLIEALAE
jgi:hypothetical protein